MANYYVDFSSGTNGTGTAASPWNVFTATENAGVSAGDSVWFRRYIVAADTKFIAWKSGTDGSTRINYIGWPITGDEYFDSREESLKAAWDGDATQYAYQRRLTYVADTPAALLVSYINVHRFYFLDDNTNNATLRMALSTKNANYIKIKNCYAYVSYLPATTNDLSASWWGGTLGCDNSGSIEVIDSTIDGSGYMSFSRSNTIKIRNSNVTFSGCTLQYGSSGIPYISYIQEAASSYALNSTLTFNNCTLNFRQTSGNVASGYSTSNFYAHQHFISCNTTFSGCTIGINNTGTNSTTNLMPINIPIACMRFGGGTLNMQSTNTSSIQNKFTMFELTDNVAATFNNVDWTIGSNTFSNIFILIRTSITSLALSNITGSVPSTGTGYYDYENFSFGFIGWDKVSDTANITMTNMATTLGYVLDATRPNSDIVFQNKTVTDNSCAILKYNTLYVNLLRYLKVYDSDFYGVKLIQKTYVASDFIQGSSLNAVRVTLYNSTLSVVPIQVHATNMQAIDATIYNCVGAGTDILQANGNTIYTLSLVAARNRGFTGIGTIADVPWVSAKAILNDFNNGTAQYISNTLSYETSTASRSGGAGYAVKIIKKLDDNLEVMYPNIGEDATWIFFPSAATYTVTGYVIYTASSGALSSTDIKLGIDIMGAYSYENTTSVLSSDDSTWTGVVSGTIIKLTSIIAIPKEQYAPVKIYLSKRLDGLIVYFDPKLTVVEN